jgi:hypothetical protein
MAPQLRSTPYVFRRPGRGARPPIERQLSDPHFSLADTREAYTPAGWPPTSLKFLMARLRGVANRAMTRLGGPRALAVGPSQVGPRAHSLWQPVIRWEGVVPPDARRTTQPLLTRQGLSLIRRGFSPHQIPNEHDRGSGSFLFCTGNHRRRAFATCRQSPTRTNTTLANGLRRFARDVQPS